MSIKNGKWQHTIGTHFALLVCNILELGSIGSEENLLEWSYLILNVSPISSASRCVCEQLHVHTVTFTHSDMYVKFMNVIQWLPSKKIFKWPYIKF